MIQRIFCSTGNNEARMKYLEALDQLSYITPNSIHESVVLLSKDVSLGKRFTCSPE